MEKSPNICNDQLPEQACGPVNIDTNLGIHPIPILLYHSVSDKASGPFRRWAVSPSTFAEHMAFVREAGYTPMTISSLVDAFTEDTPLPPCPVAITFDDGFEDTSVHALPILERFAIPASIYIVSGLVGKTSRWLAPEGEGDRRMLSWTQVRELHAAGMECAAHGLTHSPLDTMPYVQAKNEIAQSKTLLEDEISDEVRSFAYPHGYYTPRLERTVAEEGYTSAVGVKHAMTSVADDRYALARIFVYRDTPTEMLERLLRGEGLRVAPKRSTFRTGAWRLVRRIRNRISRQTASAAVIALYAMVLIF